MTAPLPTPEHFDILILGSGEAGKYIAWTQSNNHRKKCAVIERQYIGGACPNIASLPSKIFIHSANIAYHARLAKKYGLSKYIADANAVELDMKDIVARKVEMVNGLVDMHVGKFLQSRNWVDLMRGGLFDRRWFRLVRTVGFWVRIWWLFVQDQEHGLMKVYRGR